MDAPKKYEALPVKIVMECLFEVTGLHKRAPRTSQVITSGRHGLRLPPPSSRFSEDLWPLPKLAARACTINFVKSVASSDPDLLRVPGRGIGT